jgi:hypothetical protein
MAVAAIICDLIPSDWEPSIEADVNGREAGFRITSPDYRKSVVFSENRNSDSIVLYVGRATEFSMQGNVPSEAVYKASHHFGEEDYLGAAKTAVAYLVGVPS